ncbi:11211_t:CDS:2, partial [Paraglomus occultum]
MSTPVRPISDIYTGGRIKRHPSLLKSKPPLPPRTQELRTVIEENDQQPSTASRPALPPRETKTAADFYNSPAKSKSRDKRTDDSTVKKKKRTSLFRMSMTFINGDGSQKNTSDEKDDNVLIPPPELPPRPSVPRSLQKYKRWNRRSSVSPADKALPNLPPPIILGKGSNKFYRKFDAWFAKKCPKVYIYRHALYVGLGLFLLGLFVIIICAAAGSFAKDHENKGANSSGKGGDGDVGTGGLDLTGSGDGTYYDPGIGTGSCGTLHTADEMVAALNAPQYGNYANPNDSPVCGKCVQVTGPKGTVKVKIVDKCPVCKNGDIDLSPAAFDKIADEAVGRVPVTWKG